MEGIGSRMQELDIFRGFNNWKFEMTGRNSIIMTETTHSNVLL